MRLTALLACLLASSVSAQTTSLAEGWGNLPPFERLQLLDAGLRAPEDPIRPSHRDTILRAGNFAFRSYPTLFSMPADPHYTVRDGAAYQLLYLTNPAEHFGTYFQEGYIVLNARSLASLTDQALTHTTLHESFHAFQAATRAAARYPNWVLEGSAEAASALAYGEMPGQNERDLYTKGSESSRGKVIGMRPYDRPLHRMAEVLEGIGNPNSPVDYMTGSFWRFLLRASNDWSKLLGRVFAEVPASKSEDDSLKAVDSVLRASRAWQGGIAQAFPAFLADFTELPVRENLPNRDLFTTDRWLNNLFADGCTDLRFGGKNLTWTGRVHVQPVAGRCLSARLDYPDGKAADDNAAYYFISVEAVSVHADDCRDLALGTRGRTVPAAPIERPGEGGCRVSWIFPYDLRDPARTDNRQPFVISNVSVSEPVATRLKRIDLTVTVPLAEAAGAASSAGSAGQPGSKMPPTAAKSGGRTHIPNSATASRTIPNPESAVADRAACDPELLAANRCGPQTRISLLLGGAGLVAAGSLSALGSGGVMSSLMLPSDASSATAPQGTVMIELLVPQFEPGFTGSVENADIRVEWLSEGVSGKVDANGPKVARSSCPGTGHPLEGVYAPSGRVTIDASGTGGIQGSFTTTLYEDPAPSDDQCDPPRRRAGELSGTFTTAAVATTFEETPPPLLEDMQARLFDTVPYEALALVDYKEMLAGIGAESAEGEDMAAEGAGDPVPAGQVCNCSCEESTTEDAKFCAEPCALHYQSCAIDEPTENELDALLTNLFSDAPSEATATAQQAYREAWRVAGLDERRQILVLLRLQVQSME